VEIPQVVRFGYVVDARGTPVNQIQVVDASAWLADPGQAIHRVRRDRPVPGHPKVRQEELAGTARTPAPHGSRKRLSVAVAAARPAIVEILLIEGFNSFSFCMM